MCIHLVDVCVCSPVKAWHVAWHELFAWCCFLLHLWMLFHCRHCMVSLASARLVAGNVLTTTKTSLARIDWTLM